ncbi:MAG: UbiA family prenyltransferase [Pseudohongiellaceae bacterium]
MSRQHAVMNSRQFPEPGAVLTLLKPITWFPPMWAFACGIVSVWGSGTLTWPAMVGGVLLAGPLVCGTSQAVNDWFDRHVDAINEPDRPIPSGRIPNRWGLYIAIAWTAVSALVASVLGPWVFVAAIVGLLLAWAYSAPPLRLKQPAGGEQRCCHLLRRPALVYRRRPGHRHPAGLAHHCPGWTVQFWRPRHHDLNDFKSIEGDTRMGLRSLPVQLGAAGAAQLACVVMLLPQAVVVALLFSWGFPIHATIISLSFLAQAALMRRLLTSPRELAPWYNATGVSLYVLGMLVSAFAMQSGV